MGRTASSSPLQHLNCCRFNTGSRECSLLAAGHPLVVCDWTSQGFLLPACRVFAASQFRHILERETAGSIIYKSSVLGPVSSSARGKVLATFTRQVIQEV